MDLLTIFFIICVTLIGEIFGTLFGGGSFFVQPGLLAAGIEPKLSVANDIASACFSTYAYLLAKRRVIKDNIGKYSRILLFIFPGIILGAYSGALLLKILPEYLVIWFVLTIASLGLFKMIFTNLKKRNTGDIIAHGKPVQYWPLLAVPTSLLLGFYDGLSGAGGGTLQILAFALIFRAHMKELILLAALFSGLSLTAASISFYYLDLLDFELLAIMIPVSFLAGIAASKITDFAKDSHLENAFIAALSVLLIYLFTDLLFYA